MFIETPLKDLLIYRPKVLKDARGYFFESFNASHFKERGLTKPFVQDNRSFSQQGTLRGLHLQRGEHAQAKLVTVLTGHVFDVAVDLRVNSPTFRHWYGLELKSEDPTSLYIPRGFAHGFVVLSHTAEFFYKVDNYYNKESEGGIKFDDPDLSIDWKIPHESLVLSDKDKMLPNLNQFLQREKI